MRLLLGPPGGAVGPGDEVDDDALAALWSPPRRDWWRACMVATLDGAASGPDGLSGTINDEPDHRVFAAVRAAADAVVVGAGTVRAEEYGPADVPLVVLSSRAEPPPSLRDAPRGIGRGDGWGDGRGAVEVVGGEDAEPAKLRARLAERGLHSVTVEGGPSVLGAFVAAGVVDELCLTLTPRLLGGDAGRIMTGVDVDVPLELTHLLEHDGTLLGRWLVGRGGVR